MTVRVNKSSFNIREKLSELGRKFGLKGSELAAAETVQEARDLVSAGRKNMCINGDFRVAQRSTSMSGRTSTAYWTVDRFQTGISAAGTWTISQSTDVPDGFANSIKYDCTTADTSLDSGSELWLAQKIEAQNLQHLDYDRPNCRDCTFSFYMKTNKTGVYTVEIFQADGNRTIGFEAEVTQTGWARYEFVVPGDPSGTINNDNGVGLWLFIWMATGTGKTSGTFTNGKWAANATTNRLSPRNVNFADSTSNELYITGYQFELGRNATEFEHRSIGEELALCQRYFYINGGAQHNIISQAFSPHTTEIAVAWPHPTEMRAVPTVRISSTNNNNTDFYFRTINNTGFSLTGNGRSTSQMTKHHASIWFNGMSGVPAVPGQVRVQAGRTAFIHLSAEL